MVCLRCCGKLRCSCLVRHTWGMCTKTGRGEPDHQSGSRRVRWRTTERNPRMAKRKPGPYSPAMSAYPTTPFRCAGAARPYPTAWNCKPGATSKTRRALRRTHYDVARRRAQHRIGQVHVNHVHGEGGIVHTVAARDLLVEDDVPHAGKGQLRVRGGRDVAVAHPVDDEPKQRRAIRLTRRRDAVRV